MDEENEITIPQDKESIRNVTDVILLTFNTCVDFNESIEHVIKKLYSVCSTAKYFGINKIEELQEINCRFLSVIYSILKEDYQLVIQYFNVLKRCFWIFVESNAKYFDLKQNENNQSNQISISIKPNSQIYNKINPTQNNYVPFNQETYLANQIKNIVNLFKEIDTTDPNNLLKNVHRYLCTLFYVEKPDMNDDNIWGVIQLLTLTLFFSSLSIYPPKDSKSFKSFKICFWEAVNALNYWFEFNKDDLEINNLFNEEGKNVTDKLKEMESYENEPEDEVVINNPNNTIITSNTQQTQFQNQSYGTQQTSLESNISEEHKGTKKRTTLSTENKDDKEKEEKAPKILTKDDNEKSKKEENKEKIKKFGTGSNQSGRRKYIGPGDKKTRTKAEPKNNNN